MVADSIISTVTSTGRKPLVSEFRKIVEVPIHVWEPHFIGENFHDYIKIFNSHKCLIAFAGSTLTAQHIINCITGHLGKLRIDYESGEKFRCIVRKSCDRNNLIKNGRSSIYDKGTFIPEKDFQNLLSADFVSDVVEHAINKALESKMQHVIDQVSLDAMRTEILLGLTCPIGRVDHLYKYSFQTRNIPGGGVVAYCQKNLVQANDIGVLGMVNTYGPKAKHVAQNALNTGNTLQEDITEYVGQSVRNDTTYEIGLPVVIKTIEGNQITLNSIKE
ncbi:hypothetical protein [Cognaticolwellia aestuarii]|uniref:hypothetical protein n=1 Tax=Cognaticolwellia aestuarii TaxID=329993 RepID=UPI0019310BD3|nr:hypothetical protein [Cognaticolwellia aestuarii]